MSVTYYKDYRNSLPVWRVYVSGVFAKEFTSLAEAVAYRNRFIRVYDDKHTNNVTLPTG